MIKQSEIILTDEQLLHNYEHNGFKNNINMYCSITKYGDDNKIVGYIKEK